MGVSILQLATVIVSVSETIKFLRHMKLLANSWMCCQRPCSIVRDVSLQDKEIFQCKRFRKRYSIRTNSFFQKSKLSLQILLTIIFWFSNGCSVNECEKLLGNSVTTKTIIQWFNYCRDICTTWLALHPPMFDGTVNVLNVDETAIGGKRKYHKGRIPKTKTKWLFGIVDHTNHKCLVEFIDDRKHESIIPVISRHIRQGSTIYSDGARVYKCLTNMGFNHLSVVHKNYLVDPVTGVHTNYIENLWSNLKAVLKSKRGSQGKMLEGHLDEFMYRYNRKHDGEIFELLLNDISTIYEL